ncbi:MAG: Veg family protein [Clostridia bacterium]|nr:hypothetical protein [Clostridia bacterium]
MRTDSTNAVVNNLNINDIKDYVAQFIGKNVLITRIEKSKCKEIKCKIISLSTNIFMVEMNLGKEKIMKKSFMYNDLLANKISIKEDTPLA